MVVEDDPGIATALTVYANKKGYEVISADNGVRAVELGVQHQPEVILLDMSLPGLDGRDVLVHLQKHGVAQKAVVIFVTARDSQNDRLMGLEMGATEYETKPIHLQVLFAKIERLLSKKKSGNL